MWAGDASRFDGAHYQLAHPVDSPGPVQRPHPRILVGGAGERKTLRLVARYADACNLFDIPDGGKTIRHKLGVLAGHCAEVGRPYGDIEKTVSTRIDPDETPEQFVQRCIALSDLGLDHAVVLHAGPWTEDAIGRLSTAAAALAP